MRRITLTTVGTIQDLATRAALKEVELASADLDSQLIAIAGAFSMNDTYTQTRVLNVTSPTLANTVAVLATLIDDLKRAGQFRTS